MSPSLFVQNSEGRDALILYAVCYKVHFLLFQLKKIAHDMATWRDFPCFRAYMALHGFKNLSIYIYIAI